MTAEEKKSEPAETWFSGWRKIAFWLVGAALLAVVGYRGALGARMAGASPLPGAAAAGESSPMPSASAARPSPPTPPASGVMTASGPLSAAAPGAVTSAQSAASAGSPAAAPTASAGATANPPAITADGKIILNLATEVELRKLPGIGPSRAKAILSQRERQGRFRRLEDLLRVKGLGRKRLEVLRPKIVLDAP